MQKKIKVLYIHHCPDKGGAGNSLFHLIKNIDRTQVEPIVLVPDGPLVKIFKSITDKVYPIYYMRTVNAGIGADFVYLRILRELLLVPKQVKKVRLILSIINEVKPDIIHLNESVLYILADRIKKKFNIPLVVHSRTVMDDQYPMIKSFMFKYLKRSVDKLICIDGSVENSFKAIGKNKIIYNPLHNEQGAVPSVFKKNKEQFNVLFLAGFLKFKGLLDVLDAAVLLKNEKHIKFLIAGGNPKSDTYFNSIPGRIISFLGIYPNFKKIILDRVKKEKMENLELLGFVNNIDEVIAKSHLNVFPSYMDGPSRSVFECGIYGLPSIVALEHKIEDVIEDSVTGIIIPPKSPQKLADAILKLYNDQELAEQMGLNAQKKIPADTPSEKFRRRSS